MTRVAPLILYKLSKCVEGYKFVYNGLDIYIYIYIYIK